MRYPPALRPVHGLGAPTHSAYPGSCADVFTVSARPVLHTWTQGMLATPPVRHAPHVRGHTSWETGALFAVSPCSQASSRPWSADAQRVSGLVRGCIHRIRASGFAHVDAGERSPYQQAANPVCRLVHVPLGNGALAASPNQQSPAQTDSRPWSAAERRISKAMRKAQRSCACGMFIFRGQGKPFSAACMQGQKVSANGLTIPPAQYRRDIMRRHCRRRLSFQNHAGPCRLPAQISSADNPAHGLLNANLSLSSRAGQRIPREGFHGRICLFPGAA